MSKAVEAIVDGYLFLKNREALEILLVHRQKLLKGLAEVSGFDTKQLENQIRAEIAIVRAGLERVDGTAANAQLAHQTADVWNSLDVCQVADKDGQQLQSHMDLDTITNLPAQERYTEIPLPQTEEIFESDIAQVRVLSLAVSVAATTAVTSTAALSGTANSVEPNSFSLCDNEPTPQVYEAPMETETPHLRVDTFQSQRETWSDQPTAHHTDVRGGLR